jgi:hypothetical protein
MTPSFRNTGRGGVHRPVVARDPDEHLAEAFARGSATAPATGGGRA